MKKLSIVLAAVMLLVLNSCQKDEMIDIAPASTVEKSIDVKVIDGVLTFATIDDYEAVLKEITSKNEEEVNQYIAEKGLENSLASKYSYLFEQLNSIDENEIIGFIRNNPKYLSLKDASDGDQEVVQTTFLMENAFANEDFIYQIGDQIINVKDLQANLQGGLRSNCNNPHIEEEIRDESGCSRDRKGILRAFVSRFNSGGRTRLTFQIKLSGQRKRACIWMNYKTALDFIGNTRFIEAQISNTTINMNLNSGIVGHYHANFIRTLGYSSVPATNAALSIESSFAEGTTRGIGTKTVKIDCDC